MANLLVAASNWARVACAATSDSGGADLKFQEEDRKDVVRAGLFLLAGILVVGFGWPQLPGLLLVWVSLFFDGRIAVRWMHKPGTPYRDHPRLRRLFRV